MFPYVSRDAFPHTYTHAHQHVQLRSLAMQTGDKRQASDFDPPPVRPSPKPYR
jgi:hypothetical protein